MKKAFIYLFVVGFLFTIGSCDDDLDIYNSSTNELDGNWYVQYYHADLGYPAYTPLYTYNTAADNGQEIWITDEANYWDYKVKIAANPKSLMFGSSSEVTSIIDGYEIGVIVNNGKIVKNAVKLPSGVMADSIYFEIWFEDGGVPTSDVIVAGGFRKTGFEEDEPH